MRKGLKSLNGKRLPRYLLHTELVPYRWSFYLFDDRASHEKFVNGTRSYPIETGLVDSSDGMCSVDKSNLAITVGVFNRSLGTLVHELTHAVVRLHESVGHEILGRTSEPLAYMAQHLFDLCEPFIRPQKNKKKCSRSS